MLLGIDVGGTFTDAVIIDGYEIAAQAKVPTRHDDILGCILQALDEVLESETTVCLERVVISSTIVTNALTENKLQETFLAVIAGPGMNICGKVPVKPYFVSGYVDHRGKITSPIDWTKHRDLLNRRASGCCAVSGKFSVRDPKLERELCQELRKCGYSHIFAGSELSGELNFVRRTNSAYFSAAVYPLFADFCRQVREALKQRHIGAPLYILKADGGTLPVEEALRQPVEAVFTGPAASVLGIEALAAPYVNSISLDVGGTTTDIAFWENGQPLMAKKGAMINGFATAVRAFHMRSIGIGGDSMVRLTSGGYQVGPQREGFAAAVGGKHATLSDALITAGYVNFGDKNKAAAALKMFGGDVSCEARKIVAAAVNSITDAIAEMLAEWAKQPVYTVSDIMRGTEFTPAALIGVGGGSLGLARAVGEKMSLPVHIPQGAMVANAVGAALARPTLSAALRADTTENFYIIPESGKKEPLPPKFNFAKAQAILKEWLRQQTQSWQLPDGEVQLISCEHFKTIHSYYAAGDIYNLRMQLKPGILHKIQGREVRL